MVLLLQQLRSYKQRQRLRDHRNEWNVWDCWTFIVRLHAYKLSTSVVKVAARHPIRFTVLSRTHKANSKDGRFDKYYMFHAILHAYSFKLYEMLSFGVAFKLITENANYRRNTHFCNPYFRQAYLLLQYMKIIMAQTSETSLSLGSRFVCVKSVQIEEWKYTKLSKFYGAQT